MSKDRRVPSSCMDVEPFASLCAEVTAQAPLRAAITAAYRRPEDACVAALLPLAEMGADEAEAISRLAESLVVGLRRRPRPGGVAGLIHEYALSSQEGVALMCLAEALLRIPDIATRDALIRDKIANGDWRAHVGHSPSLFVNAATWGLVVTGRLAATDSEVGLAGALTKLIARGGEPVVRKGVDLAMRLMGEQFVAGETIEAALRNARRMERKGFRYSYDMLGEAALTAADAARYLASYEQAIHAIGQAAAGRGIVEGPGVSIKLSALHPRYVRAKRGRVMAELLPRLRGLACLAKRYEIGLNIDAEEADRLDLSLDLLEALAFDPALEGWNGIGFVLQAYGRRCPFVVDWIIDLAKRSNRRLMVRLVKGAYWDSEIKRAQVDGLADYPVFTRKVHTDLSYLACARKLLGAPDAVYPQFATHNAQTLAAIFTMAGPAFHAGQYEFQCLHGMGEALYEQVVGPSRLDRPCRIYAPVGSHRTLLAYLVRRLLENGANSSFVSRILDEGVPVAELIADPCAIVRATRPVGASHPRIKLPRELYGRARANAAGIDLSSERDLAEAAAVLGASASMRFVAEAAGTASSARDPVRNPADHRDIVGHVRAADSHDVEAALARAVEAAPAWAAASPAQRADCLRHAADALEADMCRLAGLAIREAGKTLANAIGEVREAVDFLRYYTAELVRLQSLGERRGLGPIVCISPWNFPLAIFTGQIAAALAAGNPVIAKPAEQTPLIAAQAVRLLHEAGVPRDVLQLVPDAGEIGARLVADTRVQGVMFTGSLDVARQIQRTLADRLGTNGRPVPLVAETGGLNAMIVDSSAMAEQVVADVIASAFDSAGQRCSALRVLCLQEEIAGDILAMLRGAMHELEIGPPDRLSVDIGPIIDAEAQDAIATYVAQMRARGHRVESLPLPAEARCGTYVAPTIIEVQRMADVEREVFGPVLHVVRFARTDLDALIAAINAAGYGLTFGLHSRIDETIARVSERIAAGNIYINRNMIGAVVGVQPFGGHRLSGTGPKAGGPLYLSRLLADPYPLAACCDGVASADTGSIALYRDWLRSEGHAAIAEQCAPYPSIPARGTAVEFPGPVGESNVYQLRPLGAVVAIASSPTGLLVQLAAILATGNTAVIARSDMAIAILARLPTSLAAAISIVESWTEAADIRAFLFEGDAPALMDLTKAVADLPGSIRSVDARTTAELATGAAYDLARLVEERLVATNTAAAGGNAALLSLG